MIKGCIECETFWERRLEPTGKPPEEKFETNWVHYIGIRIAYSAVYAGKTILKDSGVWKNPLTIKPWDFLDLNVATNAIFDEKLFWTVTMKRTVVVEMVVFQYLVERCKEPKILMTTIDVVKSEIHGSKQEVLVSGETWYLVEEVVIPNSTDSVSVEHRMNWEIGGERRDELWKEYNTTY